MSPLLSNVNTKEMAINIFEQNKDNLIKLIDSVLCENGFDYSCSIEIKNEFFPTRKYDDMVLNSGYYDALIVNLGSGSGNNWWCVMYPNLCFNKPNNVVYKSKIMEIIEKIKG
jgi:stage II sporulation protein R